MQKQDRGRLRWRRALPLFLPAGLGMLLMAAFLFVGWMPLNLAITGQDIKISSNGRTGVAAKGLQTYLGETQMKNDGPEIGTLMAHIPDVKAQGICISMTLTFPIIDTWTIQLHSTKEVALKDVRAAAASAHLVNAKLYAATDDGKKPARDTSNVTAPVVININGADLDRIDGATPGVIGADLPGAIEFDDLQADAKGATLSGTAKLTGLGIPKFGHGRGVEHHECY